MVPLPELVGTTDTVLLSMANHDRAAKLDQLRHFVRRHTPAHVADQVADLFVEVAARCDDYGFWLGALPPYGGLRAFATNIRAAFTPEDQKRLNLLRPRP